MVKIFTAAFIFLISIFVITPEAVPSEKTEEAKPSGESGQTKISEDREAKAYELFEEILTLTETPDIKTVLPQIEALYHQIIREYPDTALAQESYWRLVMLYVDRFAPAEYEKAENIYNEFLRKYPESVIKYLIEDSLSGSYHKNEKWDKLLKLTLPAFTEFKEKGKLLNPNSMFMYAEAKFNLGDFTEAEKAYNIVIELFPASSIANTSKARLEEMKQRKDKTYTPAAE